MYEDIPVLLEDFLNYLKTVKGLSPQTVHEYYYDLRAFLQFYGDRRLWRGKEGDIREIGPDDLKKTDFNDLLAFLADSPHVEGNSASRRARKTASLRSFFDYLVNVQGYFDKNPAEKLTTPKRKKRNPVYLTLPETVRLIETAAREENPFLRYRDVAILMTFLTTGIRLSELVGMNLNSIKEGAFSVIGKGNKERMVYMTESCQEAINLYLAVRPNVADEPALFLSNRKKRISARAVQHRIDKLLGEAGFDTRIYSTHKLRHTAATLMYKEGVDIRTLQRILGHESLATTQIYTHVSDAQEREAVEKNPLAHMDLGGRLKEANDEEK